MTYGDLNGDFTIDNEDLILLGELTSDITKNTEMGDVNHDGFINCTDYIIISDYYISLVMDMSDMYTEEEQENFMKYGDMNGDGMIDMIDASMIFSISDEKRMGDINRNNVIDSEDVQLLVEYIRYAETEGKYNDTERIFYKKYGDLNKDRIIDDDDVMLLKELQNGTAINNKTGDANEDGEINISDAVLIMQSISNPSEYKLSEQGKKNADVVDGDGITNTDALAIQMTEAKLIDASDFPITSDQININD